MDLLKPEKNWATFFLSFNDSSKKSSKNYYGYNCSMMKFVSYTEGLCLRGKSTLLMVTSAEK